MLVEVTVNGPLVQVKLLQVTNNPYTETRTHTWTRLIVNTA